jgi:diguanylate cyclase (GGDEF)-like protein
LDVAGERHLKDPAAVYDKERFSILLVDDEPTVIRVLSRILNDYTPIRFATSGSVALKLARELPPDLVLLDVEMPEVSGFEVCKAFKSDSKLAAVPIIFITSHESPQLETVGLQLGGADFISKPPHAPLVLARVRTYQQLKALSDTVRSAVTMDFLTGTTTRRQSEKSLAQEWLRSHRSHAPLSLLLADIDSFTKFNDELGEEAGDACLRGVAEALRSVVHRPNDVLARYAGGKFSLLLPETSSEGAIAIAERALKAIDALPAVDRAGSRRVTLSVGGVTNVAARGFSQGPLTLGSPADMILAVEHAVRCAKKAGGHRAEFVDIAPFIAPEPSRVVEH